MTRLLAPAVSIVAAIVLATTATLGPVPLLAAAALCVALFAMGWPLLLTTTSTRWSSALVVAASGLAALAVARSFGRDSAPLTSMAAVLFGSVVLGFGQQMLRRDRSDLVETLTGTLAGQVVACMSAGWLLLPDTAVATRGVIVAALALITAVIVVNMPFESSWRGWTAFALAAVVSVIGAAVVANDALLHTSLVGIAVAAAAAGTAVLFQSTPGDRSVLASLAAGLGPVLSVGIIAYLVARLAGT